MRSLFSLSILLLLFLFGGVSSVLAQSGTVTATVRPNPLKVTVSAPPTVQVGQWFDVTADISNLGSDTVAKATATIFTPTNMSVKGQKKKVGDVSGGQTKTVTWRAKANSPDTFVIQVEVTGDLLGEQISASGSAVIGATGSLARQFLRLIFGV